jgi:hypothetical protein
MDEKIAQIFGSVPNPYTGAYGSGLTGISAFISNVLKLLIVIAGIYAVFNLVLAGYAFMSAGGDPKRIADAWAKIWQTILGLTFSVGAFILAAIIGRLLFGSYTALLDINIYGP